MSNASSRDPESLRLLEDERREKNWKRWGPYLSERQWGTVREDYSHNGDSWNYLPHDHARSRAYRWGEDGLLGIADRECRLCFALALWNGRDPILKERLFGLTNSQGNHGEDVKECYYFLDATPTHSYMKALYKYPQAQFPYAQLVAENSRRGRGDPEFELTDTGVFDDDRYFDVFAEYAKASPEDLLIRLTLCNRGPEAAALHLLPTPWFRNTWSWGPTTDEGRWPKPQLHAVDNRTIQAEHVTLGSFLLHVEAGPDGQAPALLFTENETNIERLFGSPNRDRYVKDAFHEYVIHDRTDLVNPAQVGTKAAAQYQLQIPERGQVVVRLRLRVEAEEDGVPFGPTFEQTFADRIREADEFYQQRCVMNLHEQDRRVARQAYAGLLWSKQCYQYVIPVWLNGDPAQPPPPTSHRTGRNADWKHVFNRDVLLMPDNWEYPWYAAWDLAFHAVALAHIDPHLAKEQLILLLREWYMHPNGQIPAYEWNFSDVNPPVHAWACWRVYKMTAPHGQRDRQFLERTFQKLLFSFSWWVNRKDLDGKHLFAGGFLGMDNISLFDRSHPLPRGGHLQQADGTAWVAFFCLTMLSMALELAYEDAAYEDVASKFFEHFIAITDAMNRLGGSGLWDEEDGFYYDRFHVDGTNVPARIRSMVGLVPLIAAEVLEDSHIERLPGFRKRMNWFLDHRQDLAKYIAYCNRSCEGHGHRLLAIPSRQRLERALYYLLNEEEFLSPFGIRSLSHYHREHPFVWRFDGTDYRVAYEPGESQTGLFGGNSNWRGPVWFPVNYLLIEALERYHHFYGDTLRVECPVGSGHQLTLREVACELNHRLTRLFRADLAGNRPCHGGERRYADDPHWRDLILFYEYFHGDDGRGLGANHQTGWTALVARLLEDRLHMKK
jgi:hypothetical protein